MWLHHHYVDMGSAVSIVLIRTASNNFQDLSHLMVNFVNMSGSLEEDFAELFSLWLLSLSLTIP